MDDKLQLFVEEILETNPQYKNLNPFTPGSDLPGMGGQAVVTTGASNASTDVTLSLQRATIDLAEAYRQPDISLEEFDKLANKVEGCLMMEQTLEAFSQQKVDHLLAVLDELRQARQA